MDSTWPEFPFFVAQHPNPALHHPGPNIARALRPDVHLGSPGALPLFLPINLTTTSSPDFLATRPPKPHHQPPTMSPTPKPREVVHIYIDNSNLWIQGQRTYAEKKRMSVSLDPTWRFDVGRLRDIIIEGLGVGDSPSSTFDVRTSLYGSIPLPSTPSGSPSRPRTSRSSSSRAARGRAGKSPSTAASLPTPSCRRRWTSGTAWRARL